MSSTQFNDINISLRFLKTLYLAHCNIGLSYAHITLLAPSCFPVLYFSYLWVVFLLLNFSQLENTQLMVLKFFLLF